MSKKPAISKRSTKEKLLDAAVEEFNRGGYFGTDTNRIAKAAGFAPATFYRHFADKKAVFLAAYRSRVAADWEHLAEVVGGDLPDAESRAELVRRVTRTILERHPAWRGLRASLRALQNQDDDVRACYRDQKVWQLEWLEAMQARLGTSPRTREDNFGFLLAYERICDAIIDEDCAFLGLDEDGLAAYLERILTSHLFDA